MTTILLSLFMRANFYLSKMSENMKYFSFDVWFASLNLMSSCSFMLSQMAEFYSFLKMIQEQFLLYTGYLI